MSNGFDFSIAGYHGRNHELLYFRLVFVLLAMDGLILLLQLLSFYFDSLRAGWTFHIMMLMLLKVSLHCIPKMQILDCHLLLLWKCCIHSRSVLLLGLLIVKPMCKINQCTSIVTSDFMHVILASGLACE